MVAPRNQLPKRPRGRPRVDLAGATIVYLRDSLAMSWGQIARNLHTKRSTVRTAYAWTELRRWHRRSNLACAKNQQRPFLKSDRKTISLSGFPTIRTDPVIVPKTSRQGPLQIAPAIRLANRVNIPRMDVANPLRRSLSTSVGHTRLSTSLHRGSRGSALV
jgi:hypothetical protein